MMSSRLHKESFVVAIINPQELQVPALGQHKTGPICNESWQKEEFKGP